MAVGEDVIEPTYAHHAHMLVEHAFDAAQIERSPQIAIVGAATFKASPAGRRSSRAAGNPSNFLETLRLGGRARAAALRAIDGEWAGLFICASTQA